MPNVIISPGFAAIRARATEAQYNAIGQGLQNASNIVAQAMLDYKTKAQQEDNIKLRLMDTMVQKYGASADQPMLESYDKLLAKHGVRLPRDSAGRYLPPPPQNEFQMLRQQLEKGDPDGHLMANYLEKHFTGKSKVEQAFELMKADETKRYHDLMADAANLNAEANMLRAQVANAGKGPGSSGMIRLSTGELIPDQGQEVPAGAARLSKDQLTSYNTTRLADSLTKYRAKLTEAKVWDAKRKKHELEMDFMFGEFKSVLPYIDKQAKGVFDNDPRMTKWIENKKKEALDKAGITDPVERQGFLTWAGSLVQDWLKMPNAAKDHLLSGITIYPNEAVAEDQGGPAPALTPAPSKGTKSMGIPGVEYLGPEE